MSASSGGTKDIGVKGMMFTVCKGKQGGMETGEGAQHGTALPGCHRPHRAWLGQQLALGTRGIHLGKP